MQNTYTVEGLGPFSFSEAYRTAKAIANSTGACVDMIGERNKLSVSPDSL